MSFFESESSMKRYLLFYGDSYYPSGGWDDFEGSYDTVEEALKALSLCGDYDWFHIIDTKTGWKVQ